VLPVAYSPKGGLLARHLRLYKSDPDATGRAAAAELLLALLLVFLRDHGACAWGAGRSAEPTHVAVVPMARGRPGEHPLRALIAPYLTWRWADLAAQPDERQRDLDPRRFSAQPVPGGRVLLLDDTWTTGASAQSAAMALRRAGARSVTVVVGGRHLRPDQVGLLELSAAIAPFSTDTCAEHEAKHVVTRP